MKLTKKILAAVLAALMAVSMMPLTAFASDVTDLTDQMYLFEQEMLDSNIYTNVAPAYKAYVDANEAFDAYTYGKSDNAQLVAAKNALATARSNMAVWTKPTASATTTYHANTDGGIDRAARYSVNLLASEYGPNKMGGAEGTGDTIAYDNTVANATIKVYYAENVLLYDGVTNPQFPVVYSNQVTGSKNKSRYTHTVYPANSLGSKDTSGNDSTEFVLENDKYSDHMNCWIGMDQNESRIDYSYLYQQSSKVGGNSTNSHSHWSQKYYTENWAWSSSNSKVDFYANALKYTATPSNAFETYYIIWAHRSSSNEQVSGDSIVNDDYASGAASLPTYVYNYAGIADKLASMKNLNVGAYREGGLVSYFENADVLTQSWSDMKNNASAANTAYSNINFAAATADNANQYVALRSAMNGSRTITDVGTVSVSDVINASGVLVDADNDGTPETQLDGYADFETAYNTAKGVMADLANHIDLSSNYTNGTGAANAASNLSDAFDALAVPVPEADNSYNLALDEDIDVNFILDTDFYEERSAAKVTYSYITTIDDKSAVRAEEEMSFSDVETAQGTITMNAAPAQIAEKYIITIMDGSDTVIDTIEASIQDYCKAIIEAPISPTITQKDKDVAQALLNYGALADEYFGYAEASEAVTGEAYAVEHSGDYKAAVDAESFKDKAKAHFTAGVDASGASVSVTGISYVALLDPELRFYVSQTNDVWAAKTEVSIDDPELEAKMVNTENGNCVRVTGLKASDFAKTFTLKIGTAELTYNGYAYLYTVLRSQSTAAQNLKDLSKGVYRYAAACEAKFA